jgi:hypothetical protein
MSYIIISLLVVGGRDKRKRLIEAKEYLAFFLKKKRK